MKLIYFHVGKQMLTFISRTNCFRKLVLVETYDFIATCVIYAIRRSHRNTDLEAFLVYTTFWSETCCSNYYKKNRYTNFACITLAGIPRLSITFSQCFALTL